MSIAILLMAVAVLLLASTAKNSSLPTQKTWGVVILFGMIPLITVVIQMIVEGTI